MIKKLVICLLLILIFLNLRGQDIKLAKNTVYYEFGGTGYGWISLNYDRLFDLSDKVKFTTGLGFALSKYIEIGGSKSIGDNQLLIPAQCNFLIGKSNNKIELGFGMPISINSEKFGFIAPIYVMRIGYRFQPNNKGFMFRASLNPSLILFSPKISGGLSIGYIF
jgi:hypothetical protein